MPDGLMESLRTRNISQIITERIASGILSGELLPGQRLPTEEEFAERIGAGRSSVREAIKILEALGVVEIRRADGTYVVDEFKGSMLDSVVYGILLAERRSKDVVDFKVGVQHMAADCLMAQEKGVAGQELLESADSLAQHDAAACDEKLLHAESILSGMVENPLVAELYRQSVRIAARQQELLLAALADEGRLDVVQTWARDYVWALEARNAGQVRALLERERAALLRAVC